MPSSSRPIVWTNSLCCHPNSVSEVSNPLGVGTSLYTSAKRQWVWKREDVHIGYINLSPFRMSPELWSWSTYQSRTAATPRFDHLRVRLSEAFWIISGRRRRFRSPCRHCAPRPRPSSQPRLLPRFRLLDGPARCHGVVRPRALASYWFLSRKGGGFLFLLPVLVSCFPPQTAPSPLSCPVHGSRRVMLARTGVAQCLFPLSPLYLPAAYLASKTSLQFYFLRQVQGLLFRLSCSNIIFLFPILLMFVLNLSVLIIFLYYCLNCFLSGGHIFLTDCPRQ